MYHNNQVPVEILLQIFGYLTKAEIATCLSVSKSWNTAAQTFFEPGIHIILRTAARRLHADLTRFPLFASKVTKLTVKSSNKAVFYHWVFILLLCPNIITLGFEDCEPRSLLKRVKASDTTIIEFPNSIQEIKINARHHHSPAGDDYYLCPCTIWRHKDTMTHLTLLYKSAILVNHPYSNHLIDFFISVFPGLQQLEYTNDMNAIVDLHELLMKGKNIRALYLDNVNIFFNRTHDSLLLQQRTQLQCICLCCDYIHFNALRFLRNILDRLKYVEIDSSVIVTDTDQDVTEIDYVLKHFPLLLTDILYITSDRENYTIYHD